MAIHVKCKCGNRLKVPATLVGKPFACPHCAHKMIVSSKAFNAASHSHKSGHRSTKPAGKTPQQPGNHKEANPVEPTGESDTSPFTIRLESDPNDAGGQPPAAALVEVPETVTLGYARDQEYKRTTGGRLADPIHGPKRGFWSDAFLSFVYPVRNVGNAATCAFILIISAVTILLQLASLMGLIGILFIKIWLASLFLTVIQETASGSEELPGLKIQNGMLDDFIIPALQYYGAIAVILTPAAILSLLVYTGWVPTSWRFVTPVWLAGGVFLLPISLILFAFDAPKVLLRPNLVVTTIFRTFLPYLAIWLMLLIIALCLVLTSFAPDLIEWNGSGSGGKPFELHFGLQICLTMFETYLTLVAMRIIGLYYLHFKKRFTFVME